MHGQQNVKKKYILWILNSYVIFIIVVPVRVQY